jgi:ankyrin repeat protein
MFEYLTKDVSMFNALFNELLYSLSDNKVKQIYDTNVISALQDAITKNGSHLSEALKQRRCSTDLNTPLVLHSQKQEVNQQTACLIHLAVITKDPNAASHISALINAGAKVDSITSWGMTATGLAAQFGNIDAARILISNGANANFINTEHINILQIAVVNKNLDFVKFLVREVHQKQFHSFFGAMHSAKIDINQKTADENSVTALHFSVKNNDLEMVKYLLSAGATDSDNEKVGSPLLVALAMGYEEIAKLLIGAGADIEGLKAGSKANLATFCGKETITISDTMTKAVDELKIEAMSFEKSMEYLTSASEYEDYLVARLLSKKFGIIIINLESASKAAEHLTENPSQAMITFGLKDLSDHPNEFRLFSNQFNHQDFVFDPLQNGPGVLPFYPGTDDQYEMISSGQGMINLYE